MGQEGSPQASAFQESLDTLYGVATMASLMADDQQREEKAQQAKEAAKAQAELPTIEGEAKQGDSDMGVASNGSLPGIPGPMGIGAAAEPSLGASARNSSANNNNAGDELDLYALPDSNNTAMADDLPYGGGTEEGKVGAAVEETRSTGPEAPAASEGPGEAKEAAKDEAANDENNDETPSRLTAVLFGTSTWLHSHRTDPRRNKRKKQKQRKKQEDEDIPDLMSQDAIFRGLQAKLEDLSWSSRSAGSVLPEELMKLKQSMSIEEQFFDFGRRARHMCALPYELMQSYSDVGRFLMQCYPRLNGPEVFSAALDPFHDRVGEALKGLEATELGWGGEGTVTADRDTAVALLRHVEDRAKDRRHAIRAKQAAVSYLIEPCMLVLPVLIAGICRELQSQNGCCDVRSDACDICLPAFG